MNRRSNDKVGWINFPVHAPQYKNTKEGGMFVYLVVDEPDEGWPTCCTVRSTVLYGATLIGDDVNPDREILSEEIEELLKPLPAEDFHYPSLNSKEDNPYLGALERFLSVGYLATVMLGSTGWSGWNEEAKTYWKCSYEDLTLEGKELYNTIQKLYGDKGKLYLVTWLDT